jgi:hypothetical protein
MVHVNSNGYLSKSLGSVRNFFFQSQLWDQKELLQNENLFIYSHVHIMSLLNDEISKSNTHKKVRGQIITEILA